MNKKTTLSPIACETMADVRAGVDSLDKDIVDLLTVRFDYMAAAARIKARRNAVRDEDRKQEVIKNAVAYAQQNGLPEQAIRELWDHLVEASIAYELNIWDQNN
ncbi:chorismate mutase [Parasphingorhabdus sp. DH2-15]|uniref:chorismate mutase n=1 Tax=Parasphingorhabdus sp. DH2-15 TaxID=3444112 RepID=UPI003F6867DD